MGCLVAAYQPNSRDTHTSAQRGTSPPFVMNLRMSLPAVDNGEEVLARWSDDGWYYRGKVPANVWPGLLDTEIVKKSFLIGPL